MGLVDAFEKERSLVLSIPPGSRTLREVGQQMHNERQEQKEKRKKKEKKEKKQKFANADATFFDQVSSSTKETTQNHAQEE